MKRLLAIFLIGISCLLSACEKYEATKHYHKGFRYYEPGKLDQAIEEYKKAIRIDPNHVDAHGNLANIYWKKGMYDEAIVECKETLRVASGHLDSNRHAIVRANLGSAYSGKGMYDEAIAELKKAIELTKFQY